MDSPLLTVEERSAINNGRWFASLSPSLRHDIFRCAYVRRYADGQRIVARGDAPEEWLACASGAVRISSTSASGRQITLTYMEPGSWFGDVATFDGDERTHDAYAHGATTVFCLSRKDFQQLLVEHAEFSEALIRLHARRTRNLFRLIEDLNTLPLRARLAKQLRYLLRAYGAALGPGSTELRINLQLAQEELAQLLGASRQRVNQELKALEREHVIRIEPGGLVIRDLDMLVAIGDTEG